MSKDSVVNTLRSISSLLSPISSDFEGLLADEVEARTKLSKYRPACADDDTVRVLSSFVDHLPPEGKRIIARYIATSEENVSLRELSIHLYSAILIPIRAHGGKTPSGTPSPFNTAGITTDDVAANMPQSASSSSQRRLKNLCLQRDNYRCLVTGFWDTSAVEKVSCEIRADRILPTELAHIIPFSLGKYENQEQELNIARIWATLFLLFPLLSSVEFSLGKINEPMNALTMVPAIHALFGQLKLALEPTAAEDTYMIQTYPGFHEVHFRDFPAPNARNQRLVHFTCYSNSDLPSRVLLGTHAAIARILHAAGKAEEIENILEDWEEIGCLAADGSTDLQRLLAVYLSI